MSISDGYDRLAYFDANTDVLAETIIPDTAEGVKLGTLTFQFKSGALNDMFTLYADPQPPTFETSGIFYRSVGQAASERYERSINLDLVLAPGSSVWWNCTLTGVPGSAFVLGQIYYRRLTQKERRDYFNDLPFEELYPTAAIGRSSWLESLFGGKRL